MSAESVEQFDELAELRKEVRRVGDVAQAALNVGRLQCGVRLLEAAEPDDGRAGP